MNLRYEKCFYIRFYRFPRPRSTMAMKFAYPFKIAMHTRCRAIVLSIEGKITRPAELKTEITIAHNGLTNLFTEMKYEINSTEVQRVKKPGITSAMKGYCSYSPADENILQNAAWDITNKKCQFHERRHVQRLYPVKTCFRFLRGLQAYTDKLQSTTDTEQIDVGCERTTLHQRGRRRHGYRGG